MLSGIVYATRADIPLGENNHTELTALLRTDRSVANPDIQLYPIHAPYSAARPTSRRPVSPSPQPSRLRTAGAPSGSRAATLAALR